MGRASRDACFFVVREQQNFAFTDGRGRYMI